MIVFDITSRSSFDSLDNWRSETERCCSGNARIMVVGCKNDMSGDRQVSYEEAMAYCGSYSLPYMEVSAKNNVNLAEAFYTLTERTHLSQIGTVSKSSTNLSSCSSNAEFGGCGGWWEP